jgi:hypothetical protein
MDTAPGERPAERRGPGWFPTPQPTAHLLGDKSKMRTVPIAAIFAEMLAAF